MSKPEDRPEARAAQIQSKADEAEVIDIADARREHWVRVLNRARDMGEAAIFGVIGETEAVILPFERGE